MDQPLAKTAVLHLLAVFYIASGAELATVPTQLTTTYLGQGGSCLLGGSVFSIGLMLVVILENLLGSLFFAWLMLHSEPWQNGRVAEQAMSLRQIKPALGSRSL